MRALLSPNGGLEGSILNLSVDSAVSVDTMESNLLKACVPVTTIALTTRTLADICAMSSSCYVESSGVSSL